MTSDATSSTFHVNSKSNNSHEVTLMIVISKNLETPSSHLFLSPHLHPKNWSCDKKATDLQNFEGKERIQM